MLYLTTDNPTTNQTPFTLTAKFSFKCNKAPQKNNTVAFLGYSFKSDTFLSLEGNNFLDFSEVLLVIFFKFSKITPVCLLGSASFSKGMILGPYLLKIVAGPTL